MISIDKIQEKAFAFLDLLKEHDNDSTRTPVGMHNLNERPIFYSEGGAITYTNDKHTYWGAAMGCCATVIGELSEVLNLILYTPHNALELRKDPYIRTLIIKSSRFSSQYEQIHDKYTVLFGSYDLDDSSKSDFFNFPCIIEEFDFKHHENNKSLSLKNGINAMRVLDSLDLFIATMGKDGKAYPYLSELQNHSISVFVLELLDDYVTNLLSNAKNFMLSVEASRIDN